MQISLNEMTPIGVGWRTLNGGRGWSGKVARPRRRPHDKGGRKLDAEESGRSKLGLIFRVLLASALTRMRLTHPRPFGARRVRSCPKRLQAFAVVRR